MTALAWLLLTIASALAALEMSARGEWIAAALFIISSLLCGWFTADDIREAHRHDRRY
jgi:hypothetical protein